MVEWTDADRKAIATVWGKINIDVVGPLTLARCLIVYPWTQGYFSSFGTFTDAASITGNANVSRHGIVVLKGLEMAVEKMDDIKNTYSALSLLHSEKLHVDPDNFRLLFDCLAIVIASKMGSAFTPDIQASWHKFLSVVVSALGKQYH